jgi:HD-like signal output (HDOD) protein
MQNVGLIVAFRLIDQLYPDAALPQSDHFYAQLASHARTLSARIARMWEFPEAVSGAIEQAGNRGPAPLARTLALADRIAKLRMLVDAGRLDATEPPVLAGLDETMLACFDQLTISDDSVA